MREIKFRAWYKSTSEMIYDVENLRGKRLKPGQSSFAIQYDPAFEYADELLQYTGLKDNRGTELYEGTVLQNEDFPNEYCVIEWIDMEHFNTWLPKNKWRAIGNIYENPELLNTP